MNHRIALLLGAACVSLSPIFTKLTGVPGLASSFYRVGIAFAVFLPYILITKQYKLQLKSALKCMFCGVFFSLDLSCWNQSLMIENTATATVIGNMAPVWTGLLAWGITKEMPKLWYWIGVSCGVTGLVIMIGWDNVSHLRFSWGSVLALLASLFYAIYMVITGLVRGGIPTMRFMFYSMLGYLLTSLFISLITHTQLIGYSNSSWLYLILLAMIPQLAGWIFVNHALGSLKSTEVSLTMLVQVPIACYMGALIFHEEISIAEIIGGSLILMGIVFTYFSRMKDFVTRKIKASKTVI